MSNRRRLTSCALAVLTCWPLWACSIGPKTEIKHTIVRQGNPIQILDNRKVDGRLLATGDPIRGVDVGGWIAMPPEHWEEIKRILEQPPAPAP